MQESTKSRVEQMSWPQLAAVAPRRIGLLPVGAASKEHGRHLPLGTDLRQAEWLAAALAERVPALVWPAVHYGFYPAFVAYPGSPSLGEDVFLDTLESVLAAMTASGHRFCAVLNTGISTIGAVDRACAGNAERLAVHVYSGGGWRRAADAVSRQRGGGHADQLETAIMLHLHPESVSLAEARDESSTRFGPGPLNRGRRDAPNYSPSGAMGNPTLADAGDGRVLCRAMLGDALRALRGAARRLR